MSFLQTYVIIDLAASAGLLLGFVIGARAYRLRLGFMEWLRRPAPVVYCYCNDEDEA